MKLLAAKLFSPVDGASCAAAAASGIGAALASAGEVTMQLLGVPVPVLMGATAGAFVGRAVAPPAKVLTAALATSAWIILGCVLSPVANALSAKFGYELPGGALAGIAGLISALGPLLWPIVAERAQAWVRSKLPGAKDGEEKPTGGQP